MSNKRSASLVLEQEFLPIRAKLLEVAATLDRLDRADGAWEDENRCMQIRAAIQVLLRRESDRAEQLQLIFSRPYEQNWREKFGVM